MESINQHSALTNSDKGRLGFTILATLLMAGCYLFYTLGVNRNQSLLVVTLFAVCFCCYLYAALIDANRSQYWQWVGVALRLILFFGLPVLSDDYFRFIWDGRLLDAGINPFENLPADQLPKGIPGVDQSLFEQLNSTEYFTIYPPLNQLIFWLSAWIFPNSIFGSMTVIRSFVFLADLGNYALLRKLSAHYGINRNVALSYFLNPLVILEFTGNLHFESVMIFFILLAVYLLEQKKSASAALAMGFGIIAKLLPLMYMPAMIKYLRLKKLIVFYAIVGVLVIVSFTPLVSIEFLQGIGSSIDLYFRKFEFNASIYFMARSIGYAITGYNAISVIGPLMGLLTIGMMIGYLIFHRKNSLSIAHTLLFTHFFYLLFATTVHPWYVTTILALSVLTRYRFTIVWSGLIFLTYIGYHVGGFSLPSWVLFVEYIGVFSWLGYELTQQSSEKSSILSAK